MTETHDPTMDEALTALENAARTGLEQVEDIDRRFRAGEDISREDTEFALYNARVMFVNCLTFIGLLRDTAAEARDFQRRYRELLLKSEQAWVIPPRRPN